MLGERDDCRANDVLIVFLCDPIVDHDMRERTSLRAVVVFGVEAVDDDEATALAVDLCGGGDCAARADDKKRRLRVLLSPFGAVSVNCRLLATHRTADDDARLQLQLAL